MALLRERCLEDNLDPDEDLLLQFKAHLNRGAYFVFSQVKDISDFQNLLPVYQDRWEIQSSSEQVHDI
jgi:hypothetical protein